MSDNSGWRDLRRRATIRNRMFQLAALLLSLIALVAAFIWLLVAPLRHPNSHLIYLTAGGDPSRAIAPPPFALEQYAHLTPLRSALFNDTDLPKIVPLVTPAQLDSLTPASGIRIGSVSDSDVVLVFLAAHEFLGDSGPALRPSGRAVATDDLPIRQLLEQVRSLPGKTKMILFDLASPLMPDDGLLLPDTFGLRLAELVAQTNDNSLWMLTSHSPLEQTHESSALRRTIFGFFVARGLKGEADLDRDRVITIGELLMYVREGVTAWVGLLTDGHATQTPRLLWGAGQPKVRDLAIPILPVLPLPDELREVDLQMGLQETVASTHSDLWQGAFQGTVANRMVPGSDRIRDRLNSARLPRPVGPKPPESPPNIPPPGGRTAAPASSGTDATAPPAVAPGTTGAMDSGSPVAGPSGPRSTEPSATPAAAAATASAGGAAAPGTTPTTTTTTTGGAVLPLNPLDQTVLLDKLGLAWSIRDQLLATREYGIRPIDYAPDLWRTYEQQLLQVDQTIRAGWTFDIKPLLRAFDEQLLPMEQLLMSAQLGSALTEGTTPAATATAAAEPGKRLVDQFRQRSPAFENTQGIHSLALLIASESLDQRFDETARSALQAYSKLLRDGTYQEFTAWRQSGWDPAFESLHEFRPIAKFPSVGPEEWPLFRQWLRCDWAAERAAIRVVSQRQWRTDLLAADRVRRAGEREFTDRIRDDWQARAAASFDDAQRQYDSVMDSVEQGTRIERLLHNLLNWLPYYFALHVQGYGHPEQPFPTSEEVGELIEFLSSARQIQLALPSVLGDLKATADGLERIQARMAGYGDVAEVERLISGSVKLSDVWFLQMLLRTPLTNASSRMRLIAMLPELETVALRDFTMPDTREQALRRWRSLNASDGTEDPARMTRLSVLQRASKDWVRLQLAAFELADFRVPVADRLTAEEPHRQWAAWPDAKRSTEKILADYDSLRLSLSEDRRRWPTALETLLDRSLDLRNGELRRMQFDNLRRIGTWMRLIGVPIGSPFDPAKVSERVVSSLRYNQLAWLADRERLAAAEASAAALPEFLAAVRDYQEIAGAETMQPPLPPLGAPSLEIRGPERITLAPGETTVDIEIMVINRGGEDAELHLVVDTNRGLLDVDPQGRTKLYLESELATQLRGLAADAEDRRLNLISGLSTGAPPASPSDPPADEATADQAAPVPEGRDLFGFAHVREATALADRLRQAAIYPYQPDRAGLPPTFRLQPGESRTVPLTLRRQDGFSNQTKLLVRAISSRDHTRHDAEIVLPDRAAVAVKIVGAATSWADDSDDGIRLLPYPNRVTGYQVALRNLRRQELQAVVRVLSPRQPLASSPPDAMVPAAVAEAWLDRLGEVATVLPPVSLTLPVGGSPIEILPALLPTNPPTATGTAGGEGGASPAQPAVDAAGSSEAGAEAAVVIPPGLDISQGLLVVVHEPATETTAIQFVRLLPQRPRRYVNAVAGYDVSSGRLQLNLNAIDAAALPEAGIPVIARITDETSNPLQLKLTGQLGRDAPSVLLTADIAPDDNRQVLVEIDVDSFPRAFLFRFFPSSSQPLIPEWADASRVRILSPVAEAAFKSPIDSLTITAQVDAPVGAFLDPRDELRIGIDANRDRVFRNENPVRFGSDRQVDIRLLPKPQDGAIQLLATVSDFKFDAPAGAVSDARVNLLGSLRAAGLEAWSDPVEIVLDGQPPRLGAARVLPSRIIGEGKPLEISVSADDAGLSGVASVRFGFAAPGTNDFATVPPPVAAASTPGGSWAATVPTAGLPPGSQRLLMQAVDRVGNASTPEAVVIEIRSEAEAMAEKTRPKPVSGVVIHGKTPVEGAVVELSTPADPTKVIATRLTDAAGRFTFQRITPGEYRVSARGLVKNNRRRGEQAFAVPDGDREPTPIRLLIK